MTEQVDGAAVEAVEVVAGRAYFAKWSLDAATGRAAYELREDIVNMAVWLMALALTNNDPLFDTVLDQAAALHRGIGDVLDRYEAKDDIPF